MKRYSEFEFEKMKRDYELFSEWERYEKHFEEDEKEDWKSIQIRYINPYEYADYENSLEIVGARVNRKNNTFRLEKELCICDYICKVLISYCANNEALTTPVQLHKNKYIKAGRYTEWKGGFMGSALAAYFDVEPQKYQMGNIEDLLENTTTCMLILHNYVIEKEIDADNNDNIWSIIEKIIKAYESKQVSTELNDVEKNALSLMLIGEQLGQMNYLDTREKERKKYIKPYQKTKQKEMIAVLSQMKTEPMFDEEPTQIKCKDNMDDRRIYFSPYLAPIIAALCEYWQDNPFCVQPNLWQSISKIKCIKIAGVENDKKEKLSLEYEKFDRYFKYKIASSKIINQEDFLYKYNLFSYELVNKILMTKNPCSHNRKYIQYYLIEKIIGLQLFEAETEVICDNLEQLHERMTIDNLKRNHYKLKLILKKIFEFQGVISRVELSQMVINEYFDIYRNGKVQKVNGIEVEEILKKIEHTELIFRLRERLYIEDLIQDKEIKIGMYEEENVELVKKRLTEYTKCADHIKAVKKARKEAEYLTRKQMQKIVENEMKDDGLQNEIKKWVICASIL